MQASARINLENGSLTHNEKALALSGISGALAMSRLPVMGSDPRQPMEVARLQMGNMVAEELKAFFQIEPPGILFVEQAELQWCQGILNTQSIRIQGAWQALGSDPVRQPAESGPDTDPIGRGAGQRSGLGQRPHSPALGQGRPGSSIMASFIPLPVRPARSNCRILSRCCRVFLRRRRSTSNWILPRKH